MKDYTITKDEKKDYIIDFIENDNGTYTVLFADGKKFIVSSTDKNFEILAKQQEAQAQEAVANNSKFVLKRNIGRALTPLSGIAAGVGGYALSTLPVVQNAVGDNPVALAVGIGTIALLGAIPFGSKLVRDSGKVNELKKIKMRDENVDRLNQILKSEEYKNRYQGLKQSSKERLSELVSEGADPWSIIYIDEPYFDLEEMQILLDNGDIQDTFGFEYIRRPSK